MKSLSEKLLPSPNPRNADRLSTYLKVAEQLGFEAHFSFDGYGVKHETSNFDICEGKLPTRSCRGAEEFTKYHSNIDKVIATINSHIDTYFGTPYTELSPNIILPRLKDYTDFPAYFQGFEARALGMGYTCDMGESYVEVAYGRDYCIRKEHKPIFSRNSKESAALLKSNRSFFISVVRSHVNSRILLTVPKHAIRRSQEELTRNAHLLSQHIDNPEVITRLSSYMYALVEQNNKLIDVVEASNKSE